MSKPTYLSYSQLKLFQKCPLQWKKKYIDKKGVFEANIYSTFGQAIHDCIQNLESKNIPYKYDFKTYLRNTYEDNRKKDTTFFMSDLEVDKWSEVGNDHVEAYAKRFLLQDNYKFFASEYKLDVPIPNRKYLKLVGFIDLVMVSKDRSELILVDLKTSSRGWTKKELSENYNQLHLYAHFLRLQTKTIKPLKTCFVIFNRKEPKKIVQPILDNDKRSEYRSFFELQAMIRQAFDSDDNPLDIDFPARPSNNVCRFCQFKISCQHSHFRPENEVKETTFYY